MPFQFDRDRRAADLLRRFGKLLFVGLLALGLVKDASLAAAEPDHGEPQVARVGYFEGEVSYLEADAEEWAPVAVNAPLVTGDRFYSGPDGRAEVQLPGGVYARLSNNTELDLLQVTSAEEILRVGVGTATFRIRQVPARRHIEFSTPAAAVVARSRGVYRIDVAEDGRTTVVVREGEAEAYQGDERYRLTSGRAAEFDVAGDGGDVVPVQFYDASDYRSDPWDDWEGSRAQRIDTSGSLRYVSDDVYGAADLDQYGTWGQDTTYGPIWRPTQVSAGWAPYTNGRWVWQDPWGWSWVDYDPWGWAPSHYGRWVYASNAWAWAPGPIVSRPIYAPATVGFVGFGVNTPGFSLSVGVGGPSVGWVPLGWGEPIVPWWGGVGGVTIGTPWWGGWGGPRIVNNTVINNTNINNININDIRYANWERPGGLTAVNRADFARGELNRLDLPREGLAQAIRPIRGSLDVVPERESLFATRPDRLRSGRAVRPNDQVLSRPGVVTREVPGAPAKFEERRPLIQQANGAPLSTDQLRQISRTRGQPQAQAARIATGRRSVVPEATARFDRNNLGVRTGRAQQQPEGAPGQTSAGREQIGRTGRGAEGATAAQPGSPEALGAGRERIGRTGRGAEGAPQPGSPDAARTREGTLQRGETGSNAAERASVRGAPESNPNVRGPRGRDEQNPSAAREPARTRDQSSLGSPAAREPRDAPAERRGLRREAPGAPQPNAPNAQPERATREPAGSERVRRGPNTSPERAAVQSAPTREQTERGARRAPGSGREPEAVQSAPQSSRGQSSRRQVEGMFRAPAQERSTRKTPPMQRSPQATQRQRQPASPPEARQPTNRSRENAAMQRSAPSQPKQQTERPHGQAPAPQEQQEPTQRKPRGRDERESMMRAPFTRQAPRDAQRASVMRQPQRQAQPESVMRQPQRQARSAPTMRQPQPEAQRAPAVRADARPQRNARAPSREQAASQRQSVSRQAQPNARPMQAREQPPQEADGKSARRGGRGGNEVTAEP